MKEPRPNVERREFLLRTVPACAMACVALDAAWAGQERTGGASAAPGRHKFDNEFPGKLTYRQIFREQYALAFIPLVQVLKRSIGPDKAIALLKETSAEGVTEQADAMARRLGGRDLPALKKMFSAPELASVWTPEVVEDTDTRYRLRVTECLWAATFRQANLGEEGHAAVCLRDVAFARAFNPQIELTRDRTLMQGHDHCNHCYEVKPR